LSDKLVERITNEGRPAHLPEPLAVFEAYWQSIADPDLGIPYKRDFSFVDIAAMPDILRFWTSCQSQASRPVTNSVSPGPGIWTVSESR